MVLRVSRIRLEGIQGILSGVRSGVHDDCKYLITSAV